MFLVHIFLCIKLGFFFFLHAMVFFCASKRRKKNQISYQAAFYVSMFYDGKSWKRQIFSIFLRPSIKDLEIFLDVFDTPQVYLVKRHNPDRTQRWRGVPFLQYNNKKCFIKFWAINKTKAQKINFREGGSIYLLIVLRVKKYGL